MTYARSFCSETDKSLHRSGMTRRVDNDQSAWQQLAGYSITSSAMDIKPDGIVMPSSFAVLKLMTN